VPPSDYDGDRSNGKAFLTSCRTYICLRPDAFEDDATQIIWAMSYMKTGCAGRWAAQEFEHEARDGHLRFVDWLDFEEEFRKDFLPLNSEATAVNILETTAYFQGKQTVDDYLDRFRDLVYDSGYTDQKQLWSSSAVALTTEFLQPWLGWHLAGHLTWIQKLGTGLLSLWTKTTQPMKPSRPPTVRPRPQLPQIQPVDQSFHALPCHHASPTSTHPQATLSRWTSTRPEKPRPSLIPASIAERLATGQRTATSVLMSGTWTPMSWRKC
jgi:hypothetical protein